MPRLPLLKREELSPETQAVWDRLAATRGTVRGPSAMLMHHPAVADRVGALINQLRHNGVLSPADRELTMLTSGREVEAAYIWSAHELLGREAGVSGAAIEALRHQRPTADLPPHEALIVDVVRSLYRQHRIPADLYSQAEADLGQQALVELVVVAGCYGTVGFVLNAFEVELPAGATPAFTR